MCVLEQSLKFQKFVHYYGGGGGGHQTFDHAVKVFLKSVINLCFKIALSIETKK